MVKKEFSSFDVLATVHELKKVIVHSRVKNIYQVDSKTLLFKLHKVNSCQLRLILEAGRRLHLTSYTMEKPAIPPNFCMALRKYLRSSWLESVEQHKFERIVIFSFRTKYGIIKLFLELFGNGNIILVNEKGEILQALTFKRMRDRNIMRKESFQFPPSMGKNPLNIELGELVAALKTYREVEIVRVLPCLLSIGGLYAEELLLRAHVDKSKPCITLTISEVSSIYNSLQELFSFRLHDKIAAALILNSKGDFIDVVPFMLRVYAKFQARQYDSFNTALDEFYTKITAIEKAVNKIEIKKLKRETEKINKMITEQEKTIRQEEKRAKQNRSIGDLIYTHLSDLQPLLGKFLNAKREGKNWNDLISESIIAKDLGETAFSLFKSFDSKNLLLKVSVGGLLFDLNLNKGLFENAGDYYNRGKRAKQKSLGAMKALENSRIKLAELDAKIEEAETQKKAAPIIIIDEIARQKVKKKEWYEKFRWFISSDNFLVIAGKDAVSNEVLIKKYTDPNDVVFHANITGAPFVVVKTGKREPSQQVLIEAGEFAAAFSRAWRAGFGSVDVYWITPDQLGKAAPSGEYISRGAFAIKGKRNWLRNIPLRMSIGIVSDPEVKITGGPVESVKAKTKKYINIVPDDRKNKEIVKEIWQYLSLRLAREQCRQIRNESLEKIREYVPFTRGKIVEKV